MPEVLSYNPNEPIDEQIKRDMAEQAMKFNIPTTESKAEVDDSGSSHDYDDTGPNDISKPSLDLSRPVDEQIKEDIKLQEVKFKKE